MRYLCFIKNNARQRTFVIGQWNPVIFNIWPCSFICNWLQGSIFSRNQDILFLRPVKRSVRTGETAGNVRYFCFYKKRGQTKSFRDRTMKPNHIVHLVFLSFLGIQLFNVKDRSFFSAYTVHRSYNCTIQHIHTRSPYNKLQSFNSWYSHMSICIEEWKKINNMLTC